MQKTKISRKFYRIWLFWVGIIATFAYRIIVILNYYSKLWVEIAWYIGTLGFIWYFAHRYRVEKKREDLISEQKLAEKIEKNKELTDENRKSLVYILNGLKTSKAQWNYVVIFVFSVLALIYATYVNLAKWLG